MSHANVTVFDHPVIHTKLTELRDLATDHRKFRGLLNEIAGLMVYEVTRDWPTTPRPIRTPLEPMTGRTLARKVTLVPILRAGLGMADGVLRLLPDARMGHLGVYRDEQSLEPVSYYQKLPPDIADTEVLLIDPMLATGGSGSAAVEGLDHDCQRDDRSEGDGHRHSQRRLPRWRTAGTGRGRHRGGEVPVQRDLRLSR
jgi:uracil phosphoribosyltransferase